MYQNNGVKHTFWSYSTCDSNHLACVGINLFRHLQAERMLCSRVQIQNLGVIQGSKVLLFDIDSSVFSSICDGDKHIIRPFDM